MSGYSYHLSMGVPRISHPTQLYGCVLSKITESVHCRNGSRWGPKHHCLGKYGSESHTIGITSRVTTNMKG